MSTLAPLGLLKRLLMADMVILSASCAKAKSETICVKSSSESFVFKSSMPNTVILLSVIVPVLSTQRVSTRASVSILFMSCKRTLRRARRIALIANETLASKKSPSGIIPIIEATMA